MHSGGFPTGDLGVFGEGHTKNLSPLTYPLVTKIFPSPAGGRPYEATTPAVLYMQRVESAFFYGWTDEQAKEAVIAGNVHVLALPPKALPKIDYDKLNLVKNRDTNDKKNKDRRAMLAYNIGRTVHVHKASDTAVFQDALGEACSFNYSGRPQNLNVVFAEPVEQTSAVSQLEDIPYPNCTLGDFEALYLAVCPPAANTFVYWANPGELPRSAEKLAKEAQVVSEDCGGGEGGQEEGATTTVRRTTRGSTAAAAAADADDEEEALEVPLIDPAKQRYPMFRWKPSTGKDALRHAAACVLRLPLLKLREINKSKKGGQDKGVVQRSTAASNAAELRELRKRVARLEEVVAALRPAKKRRKGLA